MKKRIAILPLALALALGGCAEARFDRTPPGGPDFGVGSAGRDGGTGDAGQGGSGDLGSHGGSPDLGPALARDLGASDLATGTTGSPDLGGGGTLLGPPCTHGPGFVAWRFHFDPGSTSAVTDVYSLPDSSNWEAVAVYPTSIVDSGNGLELADGNWILIRYSLSGLHDLRGATFSVESRSYDVSASGSFDAWSPLYGDDATAPDAVSVYPYAWTSVDYTGHLALGDDPGLTGIRLYPGPSSSDLSVHTVELCLDAD